MLGYGELEERDALVLQQQGAGSDKKTTIIRNQMREQRQEDKHAEWRLRKRDLYWKRRCRMVLERTRGRRIQMFGSEPS